MRGHRTPLADRGWMSGASIGSLFVASACALGGGSLRYSSSVRQQAVPALVFDNVTVVDVAHGQLLPAQRVVIVGTRIQAVGAVQAVRLPRDARVVDAGGKYLIPGLWDMHSHPMAEQDLFYPLYIITGVTGIRDAGTTVPLDTVLRWRREIATGVRVGPRQVVSGPSPDDQDGAGKSPNLQVLTPARARTVVDSLQAAGADFIKVHVVSPGVYFAIAAEARRVGIPFGGHVPKDNRPAMTAITASDSGASVIDHSHLMQAEGRCMGDSASVEKCLPIAERFRRNGTWVVPTLIAHTGRAPFTRRWRRYWPETLRETRARGNAARSADPSQRSSPESPVDTQSKVPGEARMDIMQRVGMPLLTGTDAAPLFPGIPPGFSLHDEMADLVWAGLTPLTALQAATLNPAKLFRATDSLGTVAPGKLADLVLLDANPLADITNTTKIRAVVANGRYFDRAALDALLANLEQPGHIP